MKKPYDIDELTWNCYKDDSKEHLIRVLKDYDDVFHKKDKEIEQLHSIIKEVREYMQRLEQINGFWGYLNFTCGDRNNILKILDKVGDIK